MTNCRFDVVLLVKVVALVYCCCAFTPARHSLNAGVSAATLYPRDGHVVQLWTNNFTSVIHQSTKLWIVNFYLSWCGHCQRFALQYKQFAQDVEAWNSVVGVAAVVCSDQVNAALCREYGANSFPALKLFPPNAPPSPHSVEVHGDKTRASLPLVVLQYLDTLVAAGNTDSSWPKLNFVRRPGDILSDFSGTVYIVVEDSDSVARHIGQMVILDLLNWRDTVRVGRMSLADAGSLAVTARGLYGLTSFSQLYPISVEFGRHTIVEEILRRLSATALTSTASVNRLPTSTAIPRAMLVTATVNVHYGACSNGVCRQACMASYRMLSSFSVLAFNSPLSPRTILAMCI